MFICYIYIYMYEDIYICPPHHFNGFVATCRLWTASGVVHALLVLELTECLTSTKQKIK